MFCGFAHKGQRERGSTVNPKPNLEAAIYKRTFYPVGVTGEHPQRSELQRAVIQFMDRHPQAAWQLLFEDFGPVYQELSLVSAHPKNQERTQQKGWSGDTLKYRGINLRCAFRLIAFKAIIGLPIASSDHKAQRLRSPVANEVFTVRPTHHERNH